jgi:hypothetical protein
VGTSHGQLGDSGSGIFDLSGRFIGITIAKQALDISQEEEASPSKQTYKKIADHYSDTKLISAKIVNDCLLDLDDPKVS